MKYLVDAYSWIAYLEGGKSGEKVNKILQGDNEIYTLAVTVSEVISKVKRKRGNFELAYEAMISNSSIIDITPKIAKEAGLMHAQIRQKVPNFGLVDAIIAVTAKLMDIKILTGDNHLRGFKETVFI